MSTIAKTITVTEKNEVWIASRIACGDYGTASEYIRDLIRKDEAEQRGIEELRKLLQVGLDSGVSARSMDDIRRDVVKRLRADGKLPPE